MRRGSGSAVVVALWTLASLAGCGLLPPTPVSPPAQPAPQPKPATKPAVPARNPAARVKPAAIAVHATDAKGEAASNVLVLLHALDAKPERDDAPAVLDILDRRFEPAVLAVHVGDRVQLKNLDGVPHDVYSFSEARPLSLHLGAGDRRTILKFTRAGVVAVGCKIYSDMRGYIYVTDAAYFGRTDSNGFLRLPGIAPGAYRIDVWRPDRHEIDARSFPQKIELAPGAEVGVPVRFEATPIAAGARATPNPTRPTAEED